LLPATFLKTISAAWTLTTWPSPLEITIGPRQHQANAVFHPITGKEMEYIALMKDPVCNHFGHEVLAMNVGAFFKVFETFLETTRFFIKLTNILKDRKITYCKIVCDCKPH
jgi:hypothetical protein